MQEIDDAHEKLAHIPAFSSGTEIDYQQKQREKDGADIKINVISSIRIHIRNTPLTAYRATLTTTVSLYPKTTLKKILFL